ncbi:MAG: glycosyltransferase family 4 protein [Thermoleophilia bacterium]
MRILFVTPYLPIAPKMRPFGFITRLAERHEIDLVALEKPATAQAAEGSAQLAELRERCASVTIVPLEKTRALRNCLTALPSREPLRVAYCRTPAFEEEITRRLRTGRYDVLHVDRERLAGIGRLAQGTGVRTLLDYCDAVSDYNRNAAAAVGRLDQRIILSEDTRRMVRWERDVRPLFDAAIVTSPADRRALGGGGVPDVTVVPIGVDLDAFAPDDTPEIPGRLVFVGSMSYLPNVDAAHFLAKEVLPAVRRHRPEATLALVGAEPEKSVLALGELPGVTVTGMVPAVQPWMREAELIVTPLRIGGGFPQKLAEAMAMGKAVLANPEVAAGLDVAHGRELEIATRAGFADAVVDLLGDPGRRAALGASARRFAEDTLEWAPVMDLLESLYRAEAPAVA